MTFIKLLLSSSLIYIATMAIMIPIDETSRESAQRSALIDKLSHYILPLHYNMKLRLVNDYFICDCTITIYIIHATHNISFHILDPMNSIRMSNLKQADGETIYKRISTNYDKNNIVVFNYEDVLLPGKYNLYVRVEILMNNTEDSFETLYINDDKGGNDKEWLFTIGTRTKIQQILPFWNKSKLKSTFSISVKHYQRYRALSNIPIREFRLAENNMMWTYFNKTGLTSIDAIALVVSDFHRINLTDTISLWCKPQLIPHVQFASYVIKNVTTYLENYWCNSKRFVERTIVSFESKVDHVAIPNLQDEVKKVLEFVFYRETDVIYNEELDTTARKMIIAPLIARRMVQKYIGNLLIPSYWLQQWLNEGFIIFFQAYITDKALPNSRIMNLYVVQIQHELFDLNPYGVINSAVGYNSYVENDLFSPLSHFKGSIIWRMLEGILSPDKFSKVINIYLNDYYTELFEKSSDNLCNAIQSIIAELDSEYQFNVTSMVLSWAMETCFPILKVKRNYYYNFVTISAQFHNKLDKKLYYIPITYTTESKSNFTVTWSNIIWITPSKSEIELSLEKDQWIILNLQQAGYYRVNYDIENWRKIARYLNSEEYINIHVLNRAQIIDDAFYFAIEEKITFSLFLELATYLQQEKDYIAWYPMIKAFEFMSNIVAFFEFYPEFKEVRKPLVLKWNLFSENNNDDHTECLKQELAKWKCIIDDLSCIRWAHQQLKQHLINSTKYKLLPGWKRWTYCNGLRTPDRIIWNRSFNFSMKKIDYTILECLAYSGNFQMMFDYLENKLRASFETFRDIFMTSLSYNKSKSIERAEGLYANIFLSALAKNTKYMLKDILNDFNDFTYYYGKVHEMAVLTVIINNAYSKKQLDEIKKFTRNGIRESRYPFEALDDIERKLATRWSEIERQTKFFQSWFID